MSLQYGFIVLYCLVRIVTFLPFISPLKPNQDRLRLILRTTVASSLPNSERDRLSSCAL